MGVDMIAFDATGGTGEFRIAAAAWGEVASFCQLIAPDIKVRHAENPNCVGYYESYTAEDAIALAGRIDDAIRLGKTTALRCEFLTIATNSEAGMPVDIKYPIEDSTPEEAFINLMRRYAHFLRESGGVGLL